MKGCARPMWAAIRRSYSAQAAVKSRLAADSVPKVSKLPCGTVVATCENYSPVARLAFLFNAGSRYEDRVNEGITHSIRNAANLSNGRNSGLHVVRSVAQEGANFDCTTTREHMIYSIDCNRDQIWHFLELLGNVCQHPEFKHWEVSNAVSRLKFDNEMLAIQPSVQAMDALHSAIYRDGLGRSLYMPPHRLGTHSGDDMAGFMKSHMTPANMGIVATGVEHDEFVYQLQHKIGLKRDTPGGQIQTTEKAQYSGNEVRISNNSDFVHAAVVTEGVTLDSPDLAALAVLHKIMGTGPYLKYSTNMNSKLVQAGASVTTTPFSASALNINYSDTGLFGFYCVTHVEDSGKVLRAAMSAMGAVSKNGVTDQEVLRGKNQLKSSIFYDQEFGGNVLQNMGVQAMLTGSVTDNATLISAIDKVTVDDVKMVAKKVINGKPSMVAVGNLTHTPYLDQLLS